MDFVLKPGSRFFFGGGGERRGCRKRLEKKRVPLVRFELTALPEDRLHSSPDLIGFCLGQVFSFVRQARKRAIFERSP